MQLDFKEVMNGLEENKEKPDQLDLYDLRGLKTKLEDFCNKKLIVYLKKKLKI
ncbi:hypothetical protein [Borreliella turdi]|uniref:hypothetical protein n=1 Tax=Borreliella turdi TaxID=57863 RepID=UPI0015624036|nr:hypothetical protein [Borreliella turdi]